MMKDTIDSVMDTAKNAADEGSHRASRSMRQLTKGARGAAADAIKIFASGVSLISAIGVDDMLRLVGLRRRASPFATAALFGAGVFVGAGLGLLLAPAAGKQTQRALGSFAKQLVVNAEATAEDAVNRASEAAREMATAAEHKVEKATAAVEKKVENAAHAVSEKVSDVHATAEAGVGRAVEETPAKGSWDERARTASANHTRHS